MDKQTNLKQKIFFKKKFCCLYEKLKVMLITLISRILSNDSQNSSILTIKKVHMHDHFYLKPNNQKVKFLNMFSFVQDVQNSHENVDGNILTKFEK